MEIPLPTYAAPRSGAPATGDVILDIPEPSSDSQTLWCEGLAIARLDLLTNGFVTLHFEGKERLHIHICVKDLPDLKHVLISLVCSAKQGKGGTING